jgi:hypothetical protein
MITRIGVTRLRFYGCRKWLTLNYNDFCIPDRAVSGGARLGLPADVRGAIGNMRTWMQQWAAFWSCPHTQAIARDFLDWGSEVEYTKDNAAARIDAEANSVAWVQERATAYVIATSTAPGPLKGQMKGYARMFGWDWGVTGRACLQVGTPDIHSDSFWYRPQPNALEVMVLGGSAPPCQQAFGIMDCKCRTYTVDDATTMLTLKFLIQGRTSQPAHSFWLLKANGSILTGGLAMQDKLKDQGVHSGSVLYIARDEEDTPLTVHTSVHDDVRPRAHWEGERDQYRRRRQTYSIGRSKGQPAREWARSRGNRDMTLEWGDTGRDGSACSRVGILLHRHQVGF